MDQESFTDHDTTDYDIQGTQWKIPSFLKPFDSNNLLNNLLHRGNWSSVIKVIDTRVDDPEESNIRTVKRLNPRCFELAHVAEKALREITYLRELSKYRSPLDGVVYGSTHTPFLDSVWPHYELDDQGNSLLSTIYIVTDFCYESLDLILLNAARNPRDRLRIHVIGKLAYSITCGLDYIHNAELIHRDIKPANICIDRNTTTPKIIDFGFVRKVNQVVCISNNEAKLVSLKDDLTSGVQTLWYSAPEVITLYSDGTRYKNYTTSIDIFSLAVVLAEMITCVPLFRCAEDSLSVMSKIEEYIGPMMMTSSRSSTSSTNNPEPKLEPLLQTKYTEHKNIIADTFNPTQVDQVITLYIKLISKLMIWDVNRPMTCDILEDDFFTACKNLDDRIIDESLRIDLGGWTASTIETRITGNTFDDTMYYKERIKEFIDRENEIDESSSIDHMDYGNFDENTI